jgi:hypothetical protein
MTTSRRKKGVNSSGADPSLGADKKMIFDRYPWNRGGKALPRLSHDLKSRPSMTWHEKRIGEYGVCCYAYSMSEVSLDKETGYPTIT